MKLKKIVAGLLAACVAISFTGCNNGKSKDGEIPKISWYFIKPLEIMTSEELVEKEVNEILRERIGAELDIKLIEAGAWQEKMNLIISSGEEYDITQTEGTGPVSLVVNARRGAWADLTELYEKYGSAIKAKVDPRAIEANTIDGKLLQIPSEGKFVGENAYVFKKELVEKYNFDYKSVTCLEDLEPFLETIKQNEPLITPLYITAVSDIQQPLNDRHTSSTVAGVIFDEYEDKFVSYADVQKDEWKIKHDYYKKGYIAKDAFTKQDASEGKNGRYAVMRDIGAYTEDSSKSTAYYGFPTVETLVGRSIISGSAFAGGTAIGVSSKNKEKAMQLINEVWADPFILNTMAYGVEGVDYKVISGTTNEDKSVLPNAGNDQKWALYHNWIGPLFDQWDSTWNSKEALMKMKNDNMTAATSKSCGFLLNVDGLDAEIAAVSEVMKASDVILKTGSMENFDSYYADLVKKLDSAGMNEILEKINSDYEEWKKTR